MTLFDGRQSKDRLLRSARRMSDDDIRFGLHHGAALRDRFVSEGQHELAAEVNVVLEVLGQVKDERPALVRAVDDATVPVRVIRTDFADEIYAHGGTNWGDDPLK